MSNGRQKAKRNIVSFEPSGPVASMLACEWRGKGRGIKTRLLEDAIAAHLGPKYPKFLERFKILREENNGVAA